MKTKDLLIKMNQESQNGIIEYIVEQARELQEELVDLPYIKKVHYDTSHKTPQFLINAKDVDSLMLHKLLTRERSLETRTEMLSDFVTDAHGHAERVEKIKELSYEYAVVAFQRFRQRTHGLCKSIKISSFSINRVKISLSIDGKSIELSDED